jgi:transcriptional regulator with XRE-family HTH domain
LSTIVPDDLTASLAQTVREARQGQQLSANQLAERSGVSRAMIAKVERAEAQPTAALLGRLSAALGLSLSELIARAEHADRRLARAQDQPTWTDPETGYTRRALSPVSGGPLELVEVVLPPKASVSYPADAYTFIRQQIWLIDGALSVTEGDAYHELTTNDCLELGPPAPRTYSNPGTEPCRYLVAITRRH